MKHYELGKIKSPWSNFTTQHYIKLLRLAKKNYRFVGYDEISSLKKTVLWRHDVDYSLNRSLRLAAIEHKEGVKSTYFVNPHCEFYNLLENGQRQIVREILKKGHSLGLHFDAGYYEIKNETDLDVLIAREAAYISDFLGVKFSAVSFHNPTILSLPCEKERYGGLLNCYSSFLKSTIPYCTDSNGYWRFRQLWDVLQVASEHCLQVLTHPGWWQEAPMSPRERIFRCVDGRATAVMHNYDKSLALHGRINMGSLFSEFKFLRKSFGREAKGLDSRWMRGESVSVFVDLWRMLEAKLVKFCRMWFLGKLCASSAEAKALIELDTLRLPPHRVFAAAHKRSWSEITGRAETEFLAWQRVRNNLSHGLYSCPREKLEEGIVFVVLVMKQLSVFGVSGPTLHNGSGHAGLTKMPSFAGKKSSCRKWLYSNRKAIGVSSKDLNEFYNGDAIVKFKKLNRRKYWEAKC